MKFFQEKPKLGHITTFGGHPVIAAAGFESLSIILKEKLAEKTLEKEKIFRSLLQHQHIKEIRGKGLMIALILKNEKLANQLVLKSLDKGLILFWLLYEKKAVRITPPLNISKSQIKKGCKIILNVLEDL